MEKFKIGDEVVFHGKHRFDSNGQSWYSIYEDMVGKKTIIVNFDSRDNTYRVFPELKDSNGKGVSWVSPEWIELAEIKPEKFKPHKFAKETIKSFPKKKFEINQSNYTIAYSGNRNRYAVVEHNNYMINGARYVSEEDAEKTCEIINKKIKEMQNER